MSYSGFLKNIPNISINMTHYLLEHNFLKLLCFAHNSGYHPLCHFKYFLKPFLFTLFPNNSPSLPTLMGTLSSRTYLQYVGL